ncbi:DUF2062 domain-containing protein [Natronomonas sp.]|uniref:DUF2062 domain-containing protein n=1 Tax=Natronomonas sp. TaxID=2184060 RepID=UPI002609699C|nr:DUF2062 domain-containing protein [Natronomonas sp.]
MARASATGYYGRFRDELRKAFEEKHTPHEVAGSFSIGVFVTTLPSLGLGLVFFLFLARLSGRISRIAIFSSALVINPLVKAPMFIAAYWIGVQLLGPAVAAGGSLTDAAAVTLRMTLGLVVLGVAAAAVGYAVVYVLVTQYRRRDADIVEDVIDDEFRPE